jgi:2-hydroxy-3-oxopropionate reductase
MLDIGFIGLGTMGRPMARHLLAAGHSLYLHDVVPIAPELKSGGGLVCKSGREVAEEADAIIIMVPDTPQVEAVLFGKDGVAEGISKGKIVVDMSSISPLATKEFARRIEALGADYLDAPVSGGEVGAKAASLTIMVGGPERAFNTMKPVFDRMGKNVTLVGGNGDGQTTKVANQIIVALTIQAVGEALLFASRAGADPALVRKALMGGFASSRILEVHGERMVKRNFDPGFRIELHQKDLNLALEGARALGLSRTAIVQRLCRPWRTRLGSLGAGAGARDDGKPRDRGGLVPGNFRRQTQNCARGNRNIFLAPVVEPRR